jgi:hypothetical protein
MFWSLIFIFVSGVNDIFRVGEQTGKYHSQGHGEKEIMTKNRDGERRFFCSKIHMDYWSDRLYMYMYPKY